MSVHATARCVSGHVRHDVEVSQGELPVRDDVAGATEGVSAETIASWSVHDTVYPNRSGCPHENPSPFPYKQALRAYGVVLREGTGTPHR
jgi:hypothetical protein